MQSANAEVQNRRSLDASRKLQLVMADGRMLLVDTEEGRLVPDDEVKGRLAKRQPYGEWLKENQITLDSLPEPPVRPEPKEFSGKFNVRIPKSLHAALVSEAEAEGVSLNQLVLTKLALHLQAR